MHLSLRIYLTLWCSQKWHEGVETLDTHTKPTSALVQWEFGLRCCRGGRRCGRANLDCRQDLIPDSQWNYCPWLRALATRVLACPVLLDLDPLVGKAFSMSRKFSVTTPNSQAHSQRQRHSVFHSILLCFGTEATGPTPLHPTVIGSSGDRVGQRRLLVTSRHAALCCDGSTHSLDEGTCTCGVCTICGECDVR